MLKKINFRKIFTILFWIVCVLGLITALGFVNVKEKDVLGKDVSVNIDYSNGEQFLDGEDIMEFLRSRHDTIKGQKMSQIDVNALEKALLTHPAVASAEVSLSIDGRLKIDIRQRDPLVRVFLPTGESFYIDNKAKLMPLSENYTARVLVAGGHIFEPYAQMCRYDLNEVSKNKYLADVMVLDDVYRISEYITGDTLLSSLIQQINVNDQKEFELYPAVGDHKIIFGNCDDLQRKFEKLKIFYTEGLNSVDGWNRYSSINLKFEGQVVCTKKTHEPAASPAAAHD